MKLYVWLYILCTVATLSVKTTNVLVSLIQKIFYKKNTSRFNLLKKIFFIFPRFMQP